MSRSPSSPQVAPSYSERRNIPRDILQMAYAYTDNRRLLPCKFSEEDLDILTGMYPRPKERHLLDAIMDSDQRAVRYLLCVGVDPTINDNLPLRIAAHTGYVPVVREILNHPDVDPNTNSREAFHTAIDNYNLALIKVLLADDRVRIPIDTNRDIRSRVASGQLEAAHRLVNGYSAVLPQPFVNKERMLREQMARQHLPHNIREELDRELEELEWEEMEAISGIGRRYDDMFM